MNCGNQTVVKQPEQSTIYAALLSKEIQMRSQIFNQMVAAF
jgi:hypothetical protein